MFQKDNKRKPTSDLMEDTENTSLRMLEALEANQKALDQNSKMMEQQMKAFGEQRNTLNTLSEKMDKELSSIKETLGKTIGTLEGHGKELKELRDRLGLMESAERDLPPPPAPPPLPSMNQPPKAEEPKFDILIQGFPDFTLNVEIEAVLNKISKLYEGIRPPEVRPPLYRDKKGFLRFPNATARRTFLDKLRCEPPTGIEVGESTPQLSYKYAHSKEWRDRTKEVRWWGWAISRDHVLGSKARDRNIFDTDHHKQLVLLNNRPVAGFLDAAGNPVKGPTDRSKHTFTVDRAEMKKHFIQLKIKTDVDELVNEFEQAMSA